MAVRRSYTAIVERNVLWQGEFASEPYEAAWASEAIFFVRALDVSRDFAGAAHVQISADGIHWVDEGTSFNLPATKDEVTFCKVSHFGGWLRIAGELPQSSEIRVLVSLALKE
ncbi:MAG: hypothetical protein OXG23_01070 [Chloroflexi bacterium]|nr:hypothetical protein [Chloroflexota bacterium]